MSVTKLDTLEEFNKFLQDNKDKLAVVDFSAKWCGPCKLISPKFEVMSSEFVGVAFAQVDVDENEETSEKEEISAMPTFVFYKNGERIDSFTGANEEKLRAKIHTLHHG